jgi:predicted flap endonuclease-1-like 5' DNA nuclease
VGLLLQIVVFLIVAAALGFAVGWLVRGGALLTERASVAATGRTRLAQMTAGRDRPRAGLGTAGAGGAPAGRQTAADQARLARIAELENELAAAERVNARHRTEVARLEARLAELEASAPVNSDRAAAASAGAPRAVAAVAAAAPPALARPEGEPDDLQQISGIGPGIERTLHQLGIFHFRQIAAFTPEHVAWVNQRLRFRGRIEREDWIGQAKRLASGGQPLQ